MCSQLHIARKLTAKSTLIVFEVALLSFSVLLVALRADIGTASDLLSNIRSTPTLVKSALAEVSGYKKAVH